MDHGEIERLFTREDGDFVFARWGRPIVPVVFGVGDETLPVIKGACEAVCALSGHQMAETDPEMGANFLWFFCREWDELLAVPDLDRLVLDLGPLVLRLKAAGANQYRVFRFEESGAIRACFVFLRMDEALSAVAAEDLALMQVVQSMVLWSDRAFREVSPLARAGDVAVLRPEIGVLLRAAYDPVLPGHGADPSFALRLAARVAARGAD